MSELQNKKRGRPATGQTPRRSIRRRQRKAQKTGSWLALGLAAWILVGIGAWAGRATEPPVLDPRVADALAPITERILANPDVRELLRDGVRWTDCTAEELAVITAQTAVQAAQEVLAIKNAELVACQMGM